MRLIDADELRKAMYHEAFEKDTDLQKWDSGCWIKYKMFENKIEEAPTIDVVEQKHGHWIKRKIGYSTVFETDIVQYVCSECGRQIGSNGFKLENFPYCNCGAKMDEVTEDV